MPVTLRLVDHPAVGWNRSKITTSEEFFAAACPKEYRRSQRLVQSSFTRSQLRTSHISASQNGFIWAAYHAYSTHHHLVIRPEDVWFAILSQISFFVNANAEQLRSFFVDHEGQKELEVISHIADFGALAVQMTSLMAKNVVDPQLKDWVMPSFTTTTDTDQVVGAILFMGAMQNYFSYKMTVTCGLPSITLLGVVEDWKEILTRLDKLDQLGEEPRQFAEMLRPILHYMILSFEDSTNTKVTQFWNTIVHHNELFSGTDYLSGWLTAFCFWDSEGKAKHRSSVLELFADIEFPTVDIDDIPAGFSSVPVMVDDNGDVYSATMIAGSVGISAFELDTSSVSSVLREQATSIDESSADGDPNESSRDTVQPVTGWWMCENEAPEQREARETERMQLREEILQELRGHELENEDSSRKWKRLHELEAF